jgi:hypothetical protein
MNSGGSRYAGSQIILQGDKYFQRGASRIPLSPPMLTLIRKDKNLQGQAAFLGAEPQFFS